MENIETENSLASETASGMRHITRAGRLRTGRQVTNQHVLVVTGGAGGANQRTTTTRRTGPTQQPTTQPDESVSAQFAQQTTKTGKPKQRIKWDDEMNTLCVPTTSIQKTKRTWQCTDKKFTKHLSHSTLIYVLLNKELPINDV
jgi:hypothetical protein